MVEGGKRKQRLGRVGVGGWSLDDLVFVLEIVDLVRFVDLNIVIVEIVGIVQVSPCAREGVHYWEHC